MKTQNALLIGALLAGFCTTAGAQYISPNINGFQAKLMYARSSAGKGRLGPGQR